MRKDGPMRRTSVRVLARVSAARRYIPRPMIAYRLISTIRHPAATHQSIGAGKLLGAIPIITYRTAPGAK